MSDALTSEVQAVRDDKGRLLPWWLFPRLRVWGECSTSHFLTALFLLLLFFFKVEISKRTLIPLFRPRVPWRVACKLVS